ncbi:hypothetical protein EVAR_56744_1 [Eumeta japonica]|uniref:Uncharacterized protein n=1 Tax=Eumeta variegata TaxID=151549 RepID=A0A4C1ZT26_EUMVA|nr:hypothetical protein EVAR_56744_1 [Eumeta japonica]
MRPCTARRVVCPAPSSVPGQVTNSDSASRASYEMYYLKGIYLVTYLPMIIRQQQVYSENQETNYELPMKWRSKETSKECPTSKQRDQRKVTTACRDRSSTHWFRDRGDRQRYESTTEARLDLIREGNTARTRPPTNHQGNAREQW